MSQAMPRTGQSLRHKHLALFELGGCTTAGRFGVEVDKVIDKIDGMLHRSTNHPTTRCRDLTAPQETCP